MADTKTLPVVGQEAAEDVCCDPACGPETCGPTAVRVEEPKAEQKEAAAEACCDPECGPEMCG
jgi:hypothetical protein